MLTNYERKLLCVFIMAQPRDRILILEATQADPTASGPLIHAYLAVKDY